jgi:DNA (cytosine-5)-methyltransferase 1
MIYAQESLVDEIIVDNFAGGGGASTGIELATGRRVAIAINHDPDAIRMHRTNHPYTEHLQASVWDVDPVAECRGRPVGLAWFSPDCKHFSKAKGAALVDRKIRGLAWITLRWAAKVRPRVIILENVEEFQTWGPVRKGKPVKKLAGTTFRRFISQLEALGYTVEFRELVAADYGAPTSRKRFYMVARCDGKPIVWPKPTHSKTGADGLPKWRSAAEIIDWSLPCPSVFDTKAEIMERYGLKAVRPLAKNTMRRIIRGVDKFTIRSGKPFIVQQKFQNAAQNIEKPLTTVTAVGAHELCKPLLAPVTVTNTSNSVGATVGEPMNTVRTGGGGGQMLVTPFLAECNHSGGGHIAPVGDAYKTITAKHTGGIVAPSLIQYHTEQTESVRASGLGVPINTVDASNRYGLTCANLVEYYTGGRPLDIQDPMHTVTSHDREAVVAVHITKYYGGVVGEKVGEPLPTVTAIDHNAVCAAHMVKFKGDNLGHGMKEPMQTVTTSAGEFALCKAHLAKMRSGDDLGHWPEIRALLNEYCGYTLAEDEVLLLEISGALYYIADIGLRMLSPRELYNAMGFPPDYIIDRDYLGNEYKKSAQVARCGNAVCPPMATALVRANLPEWCGAEITTMAQLTDCVAV